MGGRGRFSRRAKGGCKSVSRHSALIVPIKKTARASVTHNAVRPRTNCAAPAGKQPTKDLWFHEMLRSVVRCGSFRGPL